MMIEPIHFTTIAKKKNKNFFFITYDERGGETNDESYIFSTKEHPKFICLVIKHGIL